MDLTDAGFSPDRQDDTAPAGRPGQSGRLGGELRRHPNLAVGGVLGAVVVLVAIVAIAGTRTARGLVPQLGNGVSGNREIV